jgi:glycerol-3-phosphate O-acyltransferase
MNKTTAANMEREIDRLAMCIRGTMEEEFESRLPKEAVPYSNLEKFEMIKDGIATLRPDITDSEIMDDGNYTRLCIWNAYEYPEKFEVGVYQQAVQNLQDERTTREHALETAIRRLKTQALLEIITPAELLKRMDEFATTAW